MSSKIPWVAEAQAQALHQAGFHAGEKPSKVVSLRTIHQLLTGIDTLDKAMNILPDEMRHRLYESQQFLRYAITTGGQNGVPAESQEWD